MSRPRPSTVGGTKPRDEAPRRRWEARRDQRVRGVMDRKPICKNPDRPKSVAYSEKLNPRFWKTAMQASTAAPSKRVSRPRVIVSSAAASPIAGR